MEPNPLISAPSNSSPKSSQKRTSSPGAPAPHPKKPKKDPGQGYSDKNKRRRRRKKQPITRDSGISSGLMQNVRSSSLSHEPPLPSASCSTENRHSFISSQSDSLLESSSISPSLVRSLPVVTASSSEVQPATQISLRKEHAVQILHCESKPLRDHKALLASLVSSLVCQICLDLLHKPFALSPCGHVSCYGCLVNWFNIDQQPDGLEDVCVYRKKTCPQCRAIVRGRPIEAWIIKDMAAAVVKSRLVEDLPQSVEVNSPEATSTNSKVPPQDPWANIFPPLPSRPEAPPVEGSPSAFGMYDAEDQVHRCLDCMHEIWGASCSQCGRYYSGHDVDAPDDDVSGEEHPGTWSILPVMEHIMGFPLSGNVDESDDDSYESSFIDDEDSGRHDSEPVGTSSGNDESVVEVTTLATTQERDGAGKVQTAYFEGGQDEDEKASDVGDTDEPQVSRRRPTLRTQRQVLSDNDVDNNSGSSAKSEDDGSLSRPPMRLFGRLRGRHSTVHEEECVDSRSTESDNSEDVGSDGCAFGVQWLGSECGAGAFTVTEAEDNSDDSAGW